MAAIFDQKDYYSVENITDRLRQYLGTEAWENIKQTDLGEYLVRLAANVVHQDAMAFFTGLDQKFKSTVSLAGYLEEIAKENNIIPETYQSATVTVSLYSNTTAKSYGPMDFSMEFAGTRFYNIDDITVGTASSPTTLVLYEGTVVRKASKTGTPSGFLWSYSQLESPIPVRVGNQVVRRYLLLPKQTFVNSVIVESSPLLSIPFIRWQRTETWYKISQTARAWKLGKDYLGRYRVEFGDGVYGRVFPTNDIVGVRYLLSSGEGIEVDDLTDHRILYQDVNDLTSQFTVQSVSNLVDGQSELNQDNLHLRIEGALSTRDALVKESDYKNYLESRADVQSAVVVAERHEDPPNLELFNAVRYAVKPNAEGGSFNNAEIQAHFAKEGLETVDFRNVAFAYEKFNIRIEFAALEGYASSGVNSLITSLVSNAFDWDSLGFTERINVSRIYELIKDVEGLDLSQLYITVESVYTNRETGAVQFDLSISDVIELLFYPRRFKIFLTADELVTGITGQDAGETSLYADLDGTERFDQAGNAMAVNTFNVNNVLFFGDGSGTQLMTLDARRDAGGVNEVWFDESVNASVDVLASCYVDRYEEISTVEEDGSGDFYLKSYEFPVKFFDPESLDYLLLKSSMEANAFESKLVQITPPTNATGVSGFVYFNSYLYIHWTMSTGNDRLMRYRITSSTIETEDTLYNGTGFLETSTKTYRNMVVTPELFSGENVLWLATNGSGGETGIDAVRDFDDQDSAFFENDWFVNVFTSPTYSTPIVWLGLTTNGEDLYGIRVDGAGNHVITRIYSIQSDGSAQVRHITDDSLSDMTTLVFDNFNSRLRVYFYDQTALKWHYVDYDTADMAPVVRAGDTSGNQTSIQEVATINHNLRQVTFTVALTNATVWYESEEEIAYIKFDLAMLNDLNVESL